MSRLIWEDYGPPRYDIINEGYLKKRLKEQDLHGRPVYSSDWHSFQRTVLNNNSTVDYALFKLAQRAVFALKREIPIGENSKDGHLRNKVKAFRVRNGGLARDRTVYEVHAGGHTRADKAKWHAAVYRSTYSSAEAYKKRRITETGDRVGWLRSAERRLGNG